MTIRFNLLIIFLILALLSIGYSLFNGNLLSSYLSGKNSLFIHDILFSIRLPRTFSAFVTGGLLALSGAFMQILLRNPLADPYVLGISSGASCAALIIISFKINYISESGGAFLGSLLTMILLFTLTKTQRWQMNRVLLTGIALASGFSALISFILLINSEHTLHGMLFWLMGDLSNTHLPWMEGVMLFIGLIIGIMLGKECNILLRGEKIAVTLGINKERLQMILYFLSSLLTAAAVMLAGCIGFVGLIIPHVLRLLGIHDQRLLFPAAVLLGGTLVTFADTVARTLFIPQQLPVGIMMTFIGIPVFLFLLKKQS